MSGIAQVRRLRTMRVDTSFRLFGYPGLAMILFLIAATTGVWLGYEIIGADRVRRRRT